MSALVQAMLSAVVVAVLLFEGGRCVQWTAGPDDGDRIYVCKGQILTLPWSISPHQGGDITEVTWLFHGNSDQMIAFYAHGMFVPTPSYSQRVQHLHFGGLRLSHVTEGDQGTYTVRVRTDNGSGKPQIYSQSASVHVTTEGTVRKDVSLDIKQQPWATYDNTTGQYHLQLTCRSLDYQPPSIIWTTPSKQEMSSSIKDSKGFSILLPNPVEGGRYSCRVPAAKCPPSSNLSLEGASLYVDSMEARMTIMEAKQMALRRENELKNVQLTALRQETSSLRMEISSLRREMSSLSKKNSNLSQYVQTLENVPLKALSQKTLSLLKETMVIRNDVQALKTITSKKVLFHAYLKTSISVSIYHTVVFPAVSVNQGRGYSTSTGRFTAPYSGHYYFSATAAARDWSTVSDQFANLYLVKNGAHVTYLVSKSVNYHDMGSLHYGMHLTKGQQAWIISYADSNLQGGIFHLTTFSGFLVSAD